MNQTAAPRPYHAFSASRLWALSSNTLTQLLRMRILYFLLLFGAALVVLGFIIPGPPTSEGMTSFGGEQELRLLKSVSLGAMSIFTVMLAVAGTALLLPRDLEDRTLYTILSKPVPRFEYLLGKLFGVLLLIAISLAVMDLACIGLLWLKQQLVMTQELEMLKARHLLTNDRQAELQNLYARYGVDWNMQSAVLGLFCQAAVMATVALMVSTFASSSLFTMATAFAIFIIGQGQEIAREYFFKDLLPYGAQRILAVLIALIFPDMRQFNFIDDVVAGQLVPGPVLLHVVGIAAIYVGLYQIVAWFVFSDKEL